MIHDPRATLMPGVDPREAMDTAQLKSALLRFTREVYPNPEDELISGITPDVMKILERSGAFESLDELMCPENPEMPRASCFGDYRHSREVFLARGFKEEELFDVFHVLMAKGGFCDCEILYNAADSSRLKADYWRARAEKRKPYDPHRGV